jgi:hypothetical protein
MSLEAVPQANRVDGHHTSLPWTRIYELAPSSVRTVSLVFVAVLASYLVARRAARVDPGRTLRAE